MDDISRRSETWKSKGIRMFNSTVSFSLAYILITQLIWVGMSLIAKVFQKDSIVYYYGIRFMQNKPEFWSRLKVTVVYGGGPFVALTMGLLGIYFYSKLKATKTLFNLFFLWCFVIGTSMFAAQGVIASLAGHEFLSPYYTWFACVFAWWRIPLFIVYASNVIFAIILFYFAVNYARPFLVFSYSYSKVNRLDRRRKYFFETAIIPFVLGAIVTTIVTFPMNIFIHTVFLGVIFIGLVIAWYSLAHIDIVRDDVLKYKNMQQVNFFFVILLAAVIAFVLITWRGFNLGA